VSRKAIGHSPKTIQNVFVLLLLALFACLSTFLVTIGAQLYRSTVDSAENNNTSRIMTAVVRSAIWAEDGGNVIVEKIDGWDITALTVIEEYEGETNYKRLFAYEGSLLESYTDDELGFDPKYGEPLCDLKEFEPELNGKVLTVRLKASDDTESTIRMTLRAGGAKE
jgi:lipopolysaccharide export LptBFGC system permease protein LptF